MRNNGSHLIELALEYLRGKECMSIRERDMVMKVLSIATTPATVITIDESVSAEAVEAIRAAFQKQ